MGRGSSGSGANLGNSTNGVDAANIHNERDLVSERERSRAEVDDILSVARDIENEFGVDVGQFMLADVGGKDSNTMAYSDGVNIGFNTRYFSGDNMNGAYDACVKSGFHPSRGDKTAMQAVAAHEYGHVLTAQVAAKLTMSGRAKYARSMDSVSKYIVDEAVKRTTHKGSVSLSKKISGYAGHSNAECVAEAFADVYCNGSKASAESRAVVDVMREILK